MCVCVGGGVRACAHMCLYPSYSLSPGSLPPGMATQPAARTTGRAALGSAAGILAGGRVHAAAHRGPTADAAGGTLEGFHAAVPLDVQALQPPALPALPKLHLDLIVDKAVQDSHHKALEGSEGEFCEQLDEA